MLSRNGLAMDQPAQRPPNHRVYGRPRGPQKRQIHGHNVDERLVGKMQLERRTCRRQLEPVHGRDDVLVHREQSKYNSRRARRRVVAFGEQGDVVENGAGERDKEKRKQVDEHNEGDELVRAEISFDKTHVIEEDCEHEDLGLRHIK